MANCAAGLEKLLSDEITTCGGESVTFSTGVVFWEGELATGYRACLWSRYASRILLQIGEMQVKDDTMLYEKCMEVAWEEHFDSNSTFAVEATLSKSSVISHSHFAALRVKDAIVDSFRQNKGERPSVEVTRPKVKITLHIEGDQATLFIDLSGESLHKRGYRVDGGKAPLKETLAAALVSLAGWGKSETILLDPMCGSGTILIEAALIYGDSAPGLSRSYFGFLGWKQHDAGLWESLVEEAVEREERGFQKKWPKIIGYDGDHKSVVAAQKNISRAGFEGIIRVGEMELAFLDSPGEKGTLISNLPFGERLSEREAVSHLYRAIGRKVKRGFSGWTLALFLSKAELSDRFGIQWEDSHKLYNGAIPCRLLTKILDEPLEKTFEWRPSFLLSEGEGSDFANRLKKNVKERFAWSKKNNVTCFRLYDKDLPEFNFSVDIYEKWIHVQEYSPPKTIDTKVATKRFNLGLKWIREILNVRRERVFIKTRSRQRGKSQYQKRGDHKKLYEVQEGQCSFLVNFTDYLDTGLFLDHRPTRMRIGKEAQGKRFLNLFGYTGAATIHAAKAGAESSVTVDLSATYLHWARLNLSLNGLVEERHRLIHQDSLLYLKECHETFDLIFVDPPTFSNTKKDKRVFDIQKDHNALIGLAMERLEKNGLLLFSTNFRKFKFDKQLGEEFLIKNISQDTIPFDYKRNNRVHQCWEVRNR